MGISTLQALVSMRPIAQTIKFEIVLKAHGMFTRHCSGAFQIVSTEAFLSETHYLYIF